MKISFTGDVNFTGVFNSALLNSEEIFDNQVLELFKSSDFNVVNFEGPATGRENQNGRLVRVVSPPKSIEYLSQRGIKNFNLANNHMFDCGPQGFYDTVERIRENGCRSFGAGTVDECLEGIIFEKNGIKVWVLALAHKEGLIATESSVGISTEECMHKVKERIKKVRNQFDYILINYHGGEEFTVFPVYYKRQLFKSFIDAGVDCVIGHHSHSFQGMEYYKGKPVFYSLGNFIFDLECHKNIEVTKHSAILTLEFTKENIQFNYHPVYIDSLNALVISEPQFYEQILKRSNFSKYYIKAILDAGLTYENLRNRTVLQNSNTNSELQNNTGGASKFSFIDKAKKVVTNRNKRYFLISFIIYKLTKRFNNA